MVASFGEEGSLGGTRCREAEVPGAGFLGPGDALLKREEGHGFSQLWLVSYGAGELWQGRLGREGLGRERQ